MPRIGHQVASLLLPPILSTNGCPRFRRSWTNTGSRAAGSAPVYASSALYSSERPRKASGRGGPTGVGSTVA